MNNQYESMEELLASDDWLTPSEPFWYRGKNGFKRKDHLRQHIRNYHHIKDVRINEDEPDSYDCPFEGCDRVGVNGFSDKKLMKLHLKKDHISPFQCPQPGCNRIGTNGWQRQIDMLKHMKKAHATSQ
ncbi:hypothetical protein G7Y89_g15452 [Cudoniella acicularis]|uniref:C2H2-domain containing protein second zinc finger domain-containing protein n=1 Tax=Cudoniella acicularis TaxID=354080 RepID=A0A8H4QM59_9HELO|nr:hypothetical protein G7Y89_g15452 [Cudoniella acicularis]